MLAPLAFGARHPAIVILMIHAHQMENTMQHQDADLVIRGVPMFSGLRAGPIERYSHVAEISLGAGFSGWEREDIRDVILLPELTIQSLKLGVICQQNPERASGGDHELQLI